MEQKTEKKSTQSIVMLKEMDVSLSNILYLFFI